MIRHLYSAALKPGTPPDKLSAWREALLGLRIEGMRSLDAAADLGLKEGNDGFGIVADFDDADAWRRYNQNEEHVRIRNEHAKPIVDAHRRVQFDMPEGRPTGRIRHIALISARPGTETARVEELAAALKAMPIEGMLSLHAGPDLGLFEGNAALGVVADFEDVEGFRRYDEDDEHNRIRRELLKPIAGWIGRLQFQP
jgi:hypothetical protein